MEKYLENGRPDLTGKTLGGVVLHKHIGSGSFGDVYISEDFNICVKVLFREAFRSPELYDREVDAVKFISSCIREHCGIMKFFGGGEFSHGHPFEPYFRAENVDTHFYTRYPAVTVTLGDDWGGYEGRGNAFYYLQTAADNLLESREDYIADTLGERTRRGLLSIMTIEEKTGAIVQLLDTLLFMYERISERIDEYSPDENALCAAHGDIKPDNIMFVNGYAQLGDIGASLQIGDAHYDELIGTPMFMPNEIEMRELAEKCRENSFAFAVFRDIYALGKVAAFLLYDGEPDGEDWEDSELLSAKNDLSSFHCNPRITPENVVDELRRWRNRSFRQPNRFHDQRCCSRKAPLIKLRSMYDFLESWDRIKTLDENRFLVRNISSQWRNMPDILLAKRYEGWQAEEKIRREEMALFEKNSAEERPILIYYIHTPGNYEEDFFITLSHSPVCREQKPEKAVF